VLDIEWRFGVTAATEELKHCGTSHLQLRLVLDKGNGRTQTVTMGKHSLNMLFVSRFSNHFLQVLISLFVFGCSRFSPA
jgi:hypothetical protein